MSCSTRQVLFPIPSSTLEKSACLGAKAYWTGFTGDFCAWPRGTVLTYRVDAADDLPHRRQRLLPRVHSGRSEQPHELLLVRRQ